MSSQTMNKYSYKNLAVRTSASVPDDISFFCLQQDIRREIQWFQVEKVAR